MGDHVTVDPFTAVAANIAKAVARLNNGKVDFGPIITHYFSLNHLPKAIAMQMSSQSIKVVVEGK